MSVPDDGGGTVRYNVKDLLAALDRKLDKVLEALGDKANKSEVDALAARVLSLETEAKVARTLANDREASSAQREQVKDKSLTRKQQLVTTFSALVATGSILISTHWFHFH